MSENPEHEAPIFRVRRTRGRLPLGIPVKIQFDTGESVMGVDTGAEIVVPTPMSADSPLPPPVKGDD